MKFMIIVQPKFMILLKIHYYCTTTITTTTFLIHDFTY